MVDVGGEVVGRYELLLRVICKVYTEVAWKLFQSFFKQDRSWLVQERWNQYISA